MQNSQNILILPSSSIKQAMKVLNREGSGFLAVVNSDKILLGTLTDGDIRRALTNDYGLDTVVSDVMKLNPQTAVDGTSKAEIYQLLVDKKISVIPIVDNNGRLIDIKSIYDFRGKNQHDNPVFIMAGGFGTRLKPLTDNCPKPMLKVGDKPILGILLEKFIQAGFHKFYISIHYRPEVIQDYFGNGSNWNVKIKYIHETEPLGTGGSLGLLPDDIGDLPVIVINGDILSKINFGQLLAYHSKYRAKATICVREHEYQIPFGVIENDGHLITEMVEKPIYRHYINAGIYVIEPDVIRAVPKNKNIDMPIFLQSFTGELVMYPFHDYWLDIGRFSDFDKAQKDIIALELGAPYQLI